MKIASVRTYRLLVFLLPLLLVILARDPLLDRAEALYDHIAALRSLNGLIRSTGVHIRELPEMRGDFERLARKKTEIASSLLGAKSEAALYDLLMLKARETGVSIAAMTPRSQRAGQGFAELPLIVEASGSYDNLGRFTGAVESVGRLMRVEELSMARDRTGVLTAAIRLLVYRHADTLSVEKQKKGRSEAEYCADLKAALAVAIPAPSSAYGFSGQGDPFGAVGSAPAGKTAQAGAPPKGAAGLFLKGILWKTPPLAILETLDGRTYIVRPGDSAAGFRIASIAQNEVQIVSPQGSYVLHQYDQK